MSTPDSTKKRRVATGNNGGGGVDNNGNGVDDGSCTTMSKILAKLNDMQNEMNGMKSRLSRMDELEEKCQRQEEAYSLLKANCIELEKKCTHLDTRCESLQRSVQILSKESKWEYSAPPIPLSHWRGFDEGYIGEMTSLLRNIKGYTCALRSGSALADGLYFVAGPLLQHDDLLLPNWKELANALQLCNVDYITKLSITNVQLTSQVLDLLAPALKGKQITEFVLNNNGFANNEGTKFITECIKFNHQMKSFYLINNQLGNIKNATTALDAVINHPSIDRVQLENCLGGGDINSYEVACSLFASDKTWDLLDLERNNIITEGNTTIPDYISSNRPLKYLYLAHNNLNDDDIILIAKALKGNTNLECLRLQNNNITNIGHNALAKAVYDPTSLNSISDCNHICHIPLDGGMNIPIGCSNSKSDLTSPIERRRAKIYHLLSIRNREGSNVRHLNSEFDSDGEEDNSLKLVPKVLEAVYKHSTVQGFIHPLSIIYEIMRGWKMPGLYERRS